MTKRAWVLIASVCSLVAACAVGSQLPVDDGGGGGPDTSTSSDGGPTNDATTKSDGGACTAPLIHCAGTEAGVCTDLKTSIDHCGTCGTTCTVADASALEAGSGNPDSGVPPTDAGTPLGPFWSVGSPSCDSGSCAVSCPQSMSLCSDGICYDTQNYHDNCGTCGSACQSTEYCALGHCCATGTEWCGSSCIDVLHDANNCGQCGHKCGTNLSCGNGTCTSSFTVDVFPSTGTLYDPGNNSYWSARYYTMTFASSQTIAGIAWKVNMASTDYFYGEIWDPNNTSTPLAKGTSVYGSGSEQFYNSPISYTVSANKAYLVGIYMSNPNDVFPRKDTPSYPFTVTDQLGNITISACWSTSTTNTDIFPTSTNYWAPYLRLTIQ